MREILDYVADMAQQLSEMCREHAPHVAALLHLAARLARASVH